MVRSELAPAFAVLVLLSVGVVIGGCARRDAPNIATCVPGMAVVCPCSASLSGVQTCMANGTWTACACGESIDASVPETDLGVDASSCGISCPPDFVCIDDQCALPCSVVAWGGCPLRQNAWPACTPDGCASDCTSGFADCDGNELNGCEADLPPNATCPDAGVVDAAMDGWVDAEMEDAGARDAGARDAAVDSSVDAYVPMDARVDAPAMDASLDATVADSSFDAMTDVPVLCGAEGYCDGTCLESRSHIASVQQGSEGQGWFGVDADGDGHDDLVSVQQSGSALLIYRGDGAGAFAPAVSVATGRNHGDLAFGDFDGDGRNDMLLSQPDSSQLQLVRRTATSWTADAAFSQGSTPRHVAPIDYDHDGKLDVLVYLAGSGCLVVRRGNGDGTFAAAGGCVLSVIVAYNAYTVATIDWDGDGFDDIAHAVGSEITIYRTTGTGLESIVTFAARGAVGVLQRVHLGESRQANLAVMRIATTATAPGPIDIYDRDVSPRCVDVFRSSFMPTPATGMQGVSTFVADFDADGIPDPMWREPTPSGPIMALLAAGDP